MANETPITIRGRLVGAPELRFTPAGAAVANCTIAVNHRKFDRQANEWTDDGATFHRCSAWRQLAENMAELEKGTQVIAFGYIKQRDFTDREGNNRSSMEIELDDIGPSLRNATVVVTRATGQQGAGGGGQGAGWQQRPQQQAGGWGQGGAQQAPSADPWASKDDSSAPPY